MPRRRGYWGDGDFAPSRPLPAKGGVRARSGRGAFGQNWWAKRWIAVLEGMGIGARLGRGRTYARGGRVLSIDIEEGVVRARVQGSRPTPYKVDIEVQPLPAEAWVRVGAAIAGRAAYAAKLLAGEMPQDIEEAFAESQAALFPQRAADLATNCSCPDWSNPCKHVAAVYYLIGEEFDRDPFLLFRLRGMTRDGLTELLGHGGGEGVGEPEAAAPEPLPLDAGAFWAGAAGPDVPWDVPAAPSVNAALVRRLGNLPFWRGRLGMAEALAGAYAAASERALALLAGDAAGAMAAGNGQEPFTEAGQGQPAPDSARPPARGKAPTGRGGAGTRGPGRRGTAGSADAGQSQPAPESALPPARGETPATRGGTDARGTGRRGETGAGLADTGQGQPAPESVPSPARGETPATRGGTDARGTGRRGAAGSAPQAPRGRQGRRPMAGAVGPGARRTPGTEPASGEVGPPRMVAAPGAKSRDRHALEAEVRAGVPVPALRARYDGRTLRAVLRAEGRAPE